MLDQHPHAAAVLGAALEGTPAHAYLLHGPAGTGKRAAARDFAAALLARGADDPGSARTRVQHGTHPDLTWVAPSGAHEMLRRDRPEAATACARLSLGDAERALRLALGDGPALRARAEAFARAPLAGRAHQERAWRPLLEQARAAGGAAKEEVEAALAEELSYLPKKEHKRRETEFSDRARRAERRASTGALDHALQLIG